MVTQLSGSRRHAGQQREGPVVRQGLRAIHGAPLRSNEAHTETVA